MKFPGFYRTKKIYQQEVYHRFEQARGESRTITETDVDKLPIPVAGYLRYCGWVGREMPHCFYCRFEGPFYLKKDKAMNFKIEQYSWLDHPTRLFYMKNWMIGGRHRMDHRGAFMLIKLFDRFKIADASGPEMNQAEMVTYLNDLFMLAPGGLINAPIVWETIDRLTVKATLSEFGNHVSAMVYFNEIGELIDFVSEDRFFTSNGKATENYRWSTPMSNYIEENGFRRPGYVEAIWDMPGGKFCYAKFSLKEVRYNLVKPIM